MKILVQSVILAALLIVLGCQNAITPVTPTDPGLQAVPEITSDQVREYIEGRVDVDYTVRQAAVDLPIDQCREWLAWWFADNYSDLLGNSLYGKDFMMCYLYAYAVFYDSGKFYFGSKGLFGSPAVFNDYEIYAFVAALESYGEVPYYPIEPPC